MNLTTEQKSQIIKTDLRDATDLLRTLVDQVRNMNATRSKIKFLQAKINDLTKGDDDFPSLFHSDEEYKELYAEIQILTDEAQRLFHED